MVMYGLAVCGHHHLSSALVIVRLAPVSATGLHRLGVPLHGVIVIFLGAQLLAYCLSVTLVGVRCKLPSFAFVVIRLECHSAAHYILIACQHHAGYGFQ